MRYVSRTKAYHHQACALSKMVTCRGGALLMEPGTGKTKVAIDFCGRLYMEKGVRRILVIAPLSAVNSVWSPEIEKHLGVGVPRRILRTRGTVVQKAKQIDNLESEVEKSLTSRTNGEHWAGYPRISSRESLDFILVNYESFWREPLLKTLLRYQPQCVILDESHKIKKHSTQQSKGAYQFSGIRYKLILTGTPITKWPLDIFGQWRFLKSDVFGTNWWSFLATYAKFGGYRHKEVVGFKNLTQLRRRVQHDAYIAAKEECLTLPERLFQVVRVELGSTLRRYYKQMEKEFYLSLKGIGTSLAPLVITKMLRLSQITGGFITTDDGIDHQLGSEKLQVLKDLLESYAYPDHKVVVFGRFLWEIDKIMEIANHLTLNPVRYTGGVPPEKRAEGLMRFQTDPTCRAFVAQIATGGLSIDLTVASTAVFYSLDYNLANYIQACDRLHRHGQKNRVIYLHIIAGDTIDELVYRSLEEKEDLAKILIEYAQRGSR